MIFSDPQSVIQIRAIDKLPDRIFLEDIGEIKSDPLGTRTQNLLLRRQLLYPIELVDQHDSAPWADALRINPAIDGIP